MRPMRGLDFVVGGIPRSGTTAFADALNSHPDVFCFASETGLLPLTQQISGHAGIPLAHRIHDGAVIGRDWHPTALAA